jgi:CHASE2 domain-containing sensor protein
MHARLTKTLDAAGARAIVFDLDLGADNFSDPPTLLAEAFRASGKVCLVASLEERRRGEPSGAVKNEIGGQLPHPDLLAASRGAFMADVRVDPDGYVRRFTGGGPRLERMGLETLPEHLSGHPYRVPVDQPALADSFLQGHHCPRCGSALAGQG